MPRRRSSVRGFTSPFTPEIRAAFTMVPEGWDCPSRVTVRMGAARGTLIAIFSDHRLGLVTGKLRLERAGGDLVVTGQDLKFRFTGVRSPTEIAS